MMKANTGDLTGNLKSNLGNPVDYKTAGYSNFVNYYEPFIDQWVPTSHRHYWYEEKNKTEIAFRIVQKLIDKGIVSDNITLRKFISLVNDITLIV